MLCSNAGACRWLRVPEGEYTAAEKKTKWAQDIKQFVRDQARPHSDTDAQQL